MGLIFFIASNVYAVPNVWERMLRQDTYSFNISDIKNNSLTINCATTFRNGYERKQEKYLLKVMESLFLIQKAKTRYHSLLMIPNHTVH